jgi:hypothetical protein
MEDETVGPTLCWGEKGGGNDASHSIHMAGGLDLQFREHLLASQRDSTGVEAVAAGASILSLAELLS